MFRSIDIFRKSIWLIKLPFLASLLPNFSTICVHMFSKFANQSAQKSSIFSTKASFERSLIYWFSFCLTVMVMFTSCSSDHHQKRQVLFQEWLEQNGKVKVLSTTAIINDLVREIGGEHVNTIPLIEGELDPHSYQLVKGDDEKLGAAQIIFFNGLGLEHGPSLQTYLLKNPKAYALGDWVGKHYPEQIIYVQGQRDPHFWMDISLFSKSIPFIVQALVKQDPAHAAEYEENGARLQEKMNQTDGEVRQIMQSISDDKRFLVTSHDAFHYFTRAYLSGKGEVETGEWTKRFAAPEGLAPESQLSASDIKGIIEHLRRYQIHLLFPESNVSRDSISKIVQAGKEHGLNVQVACCPLYGDAMGEPGSEGETYLKMILYNARTLAQHMDPDRVLGKEG